MAVKYLFRAGEVERAEQTAVLFTKDESQINALYDMQCMWYDLRAGDLGKVGPAPGRERRHPSATLLRIFGQQPLRGAPSASFEAGGCAEAQPGSALDRNNSLTMGRHYCAVPGCWGPCLRLSASTLQALKMFKEVEKHFADFDEDQFDFHSYCIRKMTLRAYVRL